MTTRASNSITKDALRMASLAGREIEEFDSEAKLRPALPHPRPYTP